jgi:hypothetical protein
MFKGLFGYFLAVHVLGDFYFQSSRLAENKTKSYKSVLLHCTIYFATAVVFVLPFWSTTLLVSACILSLLHFAVDSGKYICLEKTDRVQTAAIYSLDQLLHLGFIAGAASLLTYYGFELKLLTPVRDFFLHTYSNSGRIFQWIALVLLVVKPANITIKNLTAKFRPPEKDLSANKAGGFIGALERLLILLLLSATQYAAIGLVLTAKSVARYNKIVEVEHFGEYYLLGTLLSTLFAVAAYYIYV